MPRFDNSQDNDIANDLVEFGADPLDTLIALEDEMGMSLVEAVKLARGIRREEFNRQRKLKASHGHH